MTHNTGKECRPFTRWFGPLLLDSGRTSWTDLLYRIFFHPHRLSPEFPMEVTLSPDLLRKQGRKLRINDN